MRKRSRSLRAKLLFSFVLLYKECLRLAFLGHLCYHVYNNRNEVNRGKVTAEQYVDKD